MDTSKENRIATLIEPLTSNSDDEKKEEALIEPNTEYTYQEDKRWLGYLFQLFHVSLVCGH